MSPEASLGTSGCIKGWLSDCLSSCRRCYSPPSSLSTRPTTVASELAISVKIGWPAAASELIGDTQLTSWSRSITTTIPCFCFEELWSCSMAMRHSWNFRCRHSRGSSSGLLLRFGQQPDRSCCYCLSHSLIAGQLVLWACSVASWSYLLDLPLLPGAPWFGQASGYFVFTGWAHSNSFCWWTQTLGSLACPIRPSTCTPPSHSSWP